MTTFDASEMLLVMLDVKWAIFYSSMYVENTIMNYCRLQKCFSLTNKALDWPIKEVMLPASLAS